MSFVDQISQYRSWRDGVGESISRFRQWLIRNDAGDGQSDQRLQHVLERLREDKLTVAFVAEFSRGKSELINAIFFSDYGDRVLPSSAGRTTMCPTELQWTHGARPEIRLLPIRSRERNVSVTDLKQMRDAWVCEALDSTSLDALQGALARVGETERVSVEECRRLGFTVDPSGERGLKPDAGGTVEIPSWRHAVIQFRHPLLEQGLVVLDTPGLNAIGAEPELTFSMLPNAHAVLFILAADTGVTQSDLAIWREYVQNSKHGRKGRMVVLNKIDGLWDGLRDESRIDAEIDRQVQSVAEMLEISPDCVFPVSAQKGLVGRIHRNAALVERSRLPAFEHALSQDLLPTKQQIVTDTTIGEVHDVVMQARGLLEARLGGLRAQLGELSDLRGKNRNVIEYMMRKIRVEKTEFEQGLQKYYAVRTVFSNLTNNLLTHLGLETLREDTRRTREAMLESAFTRGLTDAMQRYFARLHDNLQRSATEIAEITTMLDAMYRRFSIEHGLKLVPPETFSVAPYEREIARLEKVFDSQVNSTLTLVTTSKQALTQKFFETVAVEARRTFETANRDVELWLRGVMSPLENQVREYQLQLKRRLESVKRIHQATDTLEDRIEELAQAEAGLLARLDELAACENAVRAALGLPPAEPATTGAEQAA